MKQLIFDLDKDPLGSMMLDYMAGKTDAFVQVSSPDLDMWEMTGATMFRSFSQMSRLEKKALGLCRGEVLDVGAGSGCHSLYLQKRGLHVDSLDISTGCIEVMHKRKITNPVHNNLFSLGKKRYDTILMLMNGIGICGSIDGLNLFFQFVRDILAPGGHIIVDSTDLAALYDIETISLPQHRYYGETQFAMAYGAVNGDPFDWLYIDIDTLAYYAGIHSFGCEQIMSDTSHRYLAQLSPR